MESEDLTLAAKELEALKEWEHQQDSKWMQNPHHHHSRKNFMKHCRFPPACLRLLRGIEGNLRCVDCNASNPQWAAVSYGALLCIDCSGSHRQLGVQVSVVRSISMDSWSHSEILCMLEGGNKQLNDFFHRHGLPPLSYFSSQQEYEYDLQQLQRQHHKQQQRNRYKTNAAMFYRVNLAHHVKRVEEAGVYRGRDNSFRKPRTSRGEGRVVGQNEESEDESNNTSCAAECVMAGKEKTKEAHGTVGA